MCFGSRTLEKSGEMKHGNSSAFRHCYDNSTVVLWQNVYLKEEMLHCIDIRLNTFLSLDKYTETCTQLSTVKCNLFLTVTIHEKNQQPCSKLKVLELLQLNEHQLIAELFYITHLFVCIET